VIPKDWGELHEKLERLNTKAHELEGHISENVTKLLEGGIK
jgi:hypothetical protein